MPMSERVEATCDNYSCAEVRTFDDMDEFVDSGWYEVHWHTGDADEETIEHHETVFCSLICLSSWAEIEVEATRLA
jgi:hypothetical protein